LELGLSGSQKRWIGGRSPKRFGKMGDNAKGTNIPSNDQDCPHAKQGSLYRSLNEDIRPCSKSLGAKHRHRICTYNHRRNICVWMSLQHGSEELRHLHENTKVGGIVGLLLHPLLVRVDITLGILRTFSRTPNTVTRSTTRRLLSPIVSSSISIYAINRSGMVTRK
jgi:hypothetical protein